MNNKQSKSKQHFDMHIDTTHKQNNYKKQPKKQLKITPTSILTAIHNPTHLENKQNRLLLLRCNIMKVLLILSTPPCLLREWSVHTLHTHIPIITIYYVDNRSFRLVAKNKIRKTKQKERKMNKKCNKMK